jgi:hypothetical protein
MMNFIMDLSATIGFWEIGSSYARAKNAARNRFAKATRSDSTGSKHRHYQSHTAIVLQHKYTAITNEICGYSAGFGGNGGDVQANRA